MHVNLCSSFQNNEGLHTKPRLEKRKKHTNCESCHTMAVVLFYLKTKNAVAKPNLQLKDVCGTTCHEPPNSSCAVLSVFGQQTVCPACLLVILAFVTSTLNQVTLGLDKDFIFRLVIRNVLRIYFCVNRYGVVRINIVSL